MRTKIVQLCAIDSTMNSLLKELNIQLVKANYDVIGVCSKGNNTTEIEKDGVNLVNVDIDRSINPISNFRTIYNLYKIFKEIEPDIVHVHTPVASVLGRIAAKKARVPIIIYTAHGFYFHENMPKIKYQLFLNIEKHMARKYTDFIFTQSEEDKQTALKHRFIDDERIMTIGNGVNIWDDFNPLKIDKNEIDSLYNEFNLDKSDKVITFIGRLVSEKGIFDLIEGFNMIDEPNLKLLIVGDVAKGERDMTTKKLLCKYDKNPNIIFTGYRSDIKNILYMTDIFCLPSYREGMPRSIIEAMAMECSVIATDIRGCREEVVDGETGYLVPVKSPEKIKEKIEKLVSDETLIYKMKKAGRQRAEALFDEKKVVKKQLEVFEQLMKES